MSYSFALSPASYIVEHNGVSLLIPSMVLSTLQVLVIMYFAPWLAPILMSDVQKSPT